MAAESEVQYWVLPSATRPYLLARVRWPDVAQAISVAQPEWQDDPGLFDLPYDDSSSAVTVAQAEATAAEWGARLPSEGNVRAPGPTMVRRLPARWSELTPAEKRAYSLDLVTKRRRRGDAKAERARIRAVRAGLGSHARPGTFLARWGMLRHRFLHPFRTTRRASITAVAAGTSPGPTTHVAPTAPSRAALSARPSQADRDGVIVLETANEARDQQLSAGTPGTIWLTESTNGTEDGLALVSGEEGQNEPEPS
jgi:hypothetical protein